MCDQSTPLTPRTQRGVRLTDTGLIPVEGEKAKSGKGKGNGVWRILGTRFQESLSLGGGRVTRTCYPPIAARSRTWPGAGPLRLM